MSQKLGPINSYPSATCPEMGKHMNKQTSPSLVHSIVIGYFSKSLEGL